MPLCSLRQSDSSAKPPRIFNFALDTTCLCELSQSNIADMAQQNRCLSQKQRADQKVKKLRDPSSKEFTPYLVGNLFAWRALLMFRSGKAATASGSAPTTIRD
jgi:hypothetical protein